MPALKKLISSTGLAASPATAPTNGSDTTKKNASSKLRKPHQQRQDTASQTATPASHSSWLIQGLARKALRIPTRQIPKAKPVDNFTRWDAAPGGLATADSQIIPFSPTVRGRHSWKKNATRSILSTNSGSTLSRISTFASSNGDAPAAEDPAVTSSGDRSVYPAIGALDWSKMGEEELAGVKSSFSKCIYDKPSPVDSAMDMSFDDLLLSREKGKGKARVVDVVNRAVERHKKPFEAELLDDDVEIAQHYRQVQDYERLLDEEDRDYALALQREEELRLKQEEEEEERRRLQREEEDRIEAERLQEEERVLAEERRLAEELARSLEVECVCCGSPKTPLEYHSTTATARCEHEIRICIECTQMWLTSGLESNGIEGLKCPECPNKLEHADVRRCASPETFTTYERLLTRAVLDAIPNFTWCIGPGCESGQVNEDNANFMKCQACNYDQCIKHQCAWHRAETCAAYEYRESGAKARDDERATAAMLDTVSKKCPGTNCGWRIQKTEGCDHMTCRRCRHEFCWQCLASHTEIKRVGNTAHAKDCKFHSDNLATSWPFNVH